jgi:hypothetical protein
MNRKLTAWKKSRKFGDIHGGRTRLRLTDNIFSRSHSLKRPSACEDLPILIEDNPSRDYFFPLSVIEVEQALKALPKRDYSQITHIWLRRFKKSDYENNQIPLAEFICGSGVRVIILYPIPRNMVLDLGAKKPSTRKLNELSKWCNNIHSKNGRWVARWQLPELRKYFINNLLYHEVGHHIDWYYRNWTMANTKQVEEFADQYAIQKTATATHVFNQLERQRQNAIT